MSARHAYLRLAAPGILAKPGFKVDRHYEHLTQQSGTCLPVGSSSMAPMQRCPAVHCRYSRYVIEDRWEAIRWAIGSAQTDDCVVIVGRGHKDYVDWRFGDDIARVGSPCIPKEMPIALSPVRCPVVLRWGLQEICQEATSNHCLATRSPVKIVCARDRAMSSPLRQDLSLE